MLLSTRCYCAICILGVPDEAWTLRDLRIDFWVQESKLAMRPGAGSTLGSMSGVLHKPNQTHAHDLLQSEQNEGLHATRDLTSTAH